MSRRGVDIVVVVVVVVVPRRLSSLGVNCGRSGTGELAVARLGTMARRVVRRRARQEYVEIKRMGFENPKLLHQLLTNIAENIANYAIYQVCRRSSARERRAAAAVAAAVGAGGRARRETRVRMR